MTPTLPLAFAEVVAPGTLAALVGGLVSLHAPCAWPDEEGLVPLALGLPPLLDPPHAAAARATVRSDAVTATRGAVRLGVGTVGLRGLRAAAGSGCCQAVAASLPDNVPAVGFCQALVTTRPSRRGFRFVSVKRPGTKLPARR